MTKLKVVKPKVALDPLTKKFLSKENEAGQLKLHDSLSESAEREESTEVSGTADQPLAEMSPAEESAREERTAGGNEPGEDILAEEGSTEEVHEKKDTIEVVMSAEESLFEESADSSSAETDSKTEEMTVATVEEKMTADIKEIIAAEFFEVNSYPLLYKKLTKFLYWLRWRKEDFGKMMILLEAHGNNYFKDL